MKLSTIQSTVCQFISVAFFRTQVSYAPNVDWYEVYKEMCSQSIQSLMMGALPELPIPEDLRKQWSSDCFQMIKTGIRLRYEQAEFLSILERHEIPYVVLKGTAAAMYYPDPRVRVFFAPPFRYFNYATNMRGMGDVDVYVPDKYHSELTEIITENGYVPMDDKEDYKRHRQFEKIQLSLRSIAPMHLLTAKPRKNILMGCWRNVAAVK